MSTTHVQSVADVRPLLLKVPSVCAELSLGRTKVFQLIQSGRLRAVRIGKSLRVSRRELERFLSALEESA